jgi:hypothetical protein
MEDINTLITRHLGSGLLIDTNLLLLLVVGLSDPTQISKHKRTRSVFTDEDFILLDHFAGRFRQIVTTPHVLTEVSNLLGQTPDTLKAIFFGRFKSFLELKSLTEETVSGNVLSKKDAFEALGIADCAISEVAKGRFLVLTIDFELAGHLAKEGVDVINFNYLRQLALLS